MKNILKFFFIISCLNLYRVNVQLIKVKLLIKIFGSIRNDYLMKYANGS